MKNETWLMAGIERWRWTLMVGRKVRRRRPKRWSQLSRVGGGSDLFWSSEWWERFVLICLVNERQIHIKGQFPLLLSSFISLSLSQPRPPPVSPSGREVRAVLHTCSIIIVSGTHSILHSVAQLCAHLSFFRDFFGIRLVRSVSLTRLYPQFLEHPP